MTDTSTTDYVQPPSTSTAIDRLIAITELVTSLRDQLVATPGRIDLSVYPERKIALHLHAVSSDFASAETLAVTLFGADTKLSATDRVDIFDHHHWRGTIAGVGVDLTVLTAVPTCARCRTAETAPVHDHLVENSHDFEPRS